MNAMGEERERLEQPARTASDEAALPTRSLARRSSPRARADGASNKIEKLTSFRIWGEADIAMRPEGTRRGDVMRLLRDVCADTVALEAIQGGARVREMDDMHTSAKLPVDAVAEVRRIAEAKNMSMSELISRAILERFRAP